MTLSTYRRFVKYFAGIGSLGAMIIASTLIVTPSPVLAAELVMFESAGCPWCKVFDREVAPVYDKTTEGLRAPLRRINIDRALPADLAFIQVERLTPLFVLIDK